MSRRGISDRVSRSRATNRAGGRKCTALVISGGGAKGAFATGVIRHIFETYRGTGWFSIIGGCSTGALITPLAGLLAAPPEIAEEAMEQLIAQYSMVTTADILEKKSVIEFVKRQECLNKSAPLRKRVQEVFRPECFEWLKRADMPYCYVVYTNYQSGALEVVSPKDPGMTRERFIDAMIASASVPVLMEPTIIEGQVCYDGGVRDLLPFARAIDLGAETILPIMLDAPKVSASQSRFRRLDKVLFRTLAIMLDETGENDLQMANRINLAIRAKKEILQTLAGRPRCRKKIQAIFDKGEYAELFGSEKRLVRIVEGLRPDEALTDNPLRFDPQLMRSWITLGEQKARSVLTVSPFV
ncbi:MAG: patatin-like phospholipase family protein [Spirochaetaceae bacterium]|nr:MAG: patatin-like phospholipase family protein [Spirochaetaceae bacterium]